MQLTENEIRGLCLKSREIFLSQPILLELEAPLKICGEGSTGAALAGHPGHRLGEPPGAGWWSQRGRVLPQRHGWAALAPAVGWCGELGSHAHPVSPPR